MRLTILAQAIATIGLLGSGIAHAADSADQLERVTITGSNIKRSINKEGALPVEVLKKEDIAKTGASTVSQLLEGIASITGVTPGTSSTSFVPGASYASMRGMDAKYTLVLLNGRRLATYAQLEGGTDAFNDLNTLPLSVIESVEILRDGASAIYGSDAVAGVINFKTKRNYQGTDSYVRYGQTSAGDGSEQAMGVSAGIGDLDKDGYNALISFDAYHREPVFYSKHDPIKSRDFRRFGGDDNRFLSTWGGWRISPKQQYIAMPYCPSPLVTKATGQVICPIDYDQVDDQKSPRTSRYGLLSVGTKKLDANSEIYAELGLNQTQTMLRGGNNFLNAITLSPKDAAYPKDPSLIAALQAMNPNFVPGTSNITIYRGLNEGWGRDRDATSTTYHAVVGYSTSRWDWDFDASINLSGNKVVNKNQDYLTTLEDSQSTGNPSGPTYNPFIHGNPTNSLSPFQALDQNKATSALQALELKASKSELFNLPGGAAGFATGLQWWHESLESEPDANTQQGLVMNSAPQSYLKASHSILAAYGEFNLPITKQLEVQLALRGDHYNDFGNTVNPKIAFAYHPWKEVLFRGSASSGFKAPSFTQLHLTRTAYSSVKDYDLCAQQGISKSKCQANSVKIISGGNPNLQPETSDSFSLGMVFQPTKELYASVDFYRINQKKVINAIDTEDVMTNPAKYPGAIVRKPAQNGLLGDIDHINTPYQNTGGLSTSGLDIIARYDWSLGSYGKLKFENQHSRILSYKDHKLADDPWLEELDYAVETRWKNVFTTEYSYDKYSVGLTARSYAGFKNLTQAISNTSSLQGKSERVASYTAFDVYLSATPLKKLKIEGGIKNIGNRVPPYFSNSSTPGTFNGPATDLWGRTYYMNVNYKF
ncbi:TonB-dependent siderophore receptor [Chromobacterium sp. IIBBL 290-4]|uniref:TonB-dependent receptor plug domain-containing protein n=1 Tax=Chromobacterium sp. IIBBL 290-4 TaxID=2953890 RepID=UPI0020B83947|nr:TonB-dependent receptor [Chromobacterium sp. IIBBL 290-4]UTH75819.1 TonB-dependent receptor [Chromobacterium sp. IIBBL 290-4]